MDKDLRDLERTILSGDVSRLPEYIHNQERAGKSQTIYLVVGDSFEYNDNFYYQPECGGCEPIRAFLDEDVAKREAGNLNIAWLRREASELGDWGYEGLPSIFNIENLEEFLTQHGATLLDDGINVDNCSDEQCWQIISAMNITTYSIRTIKLTDGLCSPDEILLFCNAAEHAESLLEEGDEEDGN